MLKLCVIGILYIFSNTPLALPTDPLSTEPSTDTQTDLLLPNGTKEVVLNVSQSLPLTNQSLASSVSFNNCSSNSSECSADINCKNNLCLNNGTCSEVNGSWKCLCTTGFDGSKCEVETTPCSGHVCLNGGTCSESMGNFTCTCPQETVNLTEYSLDKRQLIHRVGYDGTRCEKWIDACSLLPNICLSGKCAPDNSTMYGYVCYCPQGDKLSTGVHCQYKTGICQLKSDTCANGGTCQTLERENYKCLCPPGFTGNSCEIDIDECQSNPCLLNGTCTDGVNKFTCACIDGTTGATCDYNINECTSDPCQNGGKCTDHINRFTCNCTGTGYSGSFCQNEVNECLSSPCQNNATCSDGLSNYTCSCHPGYEGVNCQSYINECLNVSCQNNGTCLQNRKVYPSSWTLHAGFTCQCVNGFNGTYCEENINDCESSRCKYGSCIDGINSFTCECKRGYKGELCDIEINECEEYKPCSNDASCIPTHADYRCVCSNKTFFGGKNCSVELTGCKNNSCSNGSTCKPVLLDEKLGEHSYSCSCQPGFGGVHCEIDTSLSFNKNSLVVIHPGVLNTVSFKFRTTYSEVLLMTYISKDDDYRLTLVMLNGTCLQLISYNINYNDSILPTVNLCIDGHSFLNSSDWIEMKIYFYQSMVHLLLFHPTCLGGFCQVDMENNQTEKLSNGSLHIGRIAVIPNNSLSIIPKSSFFVGCINDLKVNGELVYNDSNSSKFSLVSPLCQRTPQCLNRCRNSGRCIDLWNEFRCECMRPYYGVTCLEEASIATFGYNFKRSLAFFNVSNVYDTFDLTKGFEVSMFLRTRENNGFLFLIILDDDQQNNNDSATLNFISGELISGNLVIKIQLFEGHQNFSEEFSLSGISEITDGRKHFLELKSNFSTLTLSLDGSLRAMKEIIVPKPSVINMLTVYIGDGEIILSNQYMMKTDNSILGTLSRVPGCFGSVQDFRLNGVLLDFESNSSQPVGSTLRIVPMSFSYNLCSGELTSELCRLKSPCRNNATCEDVFFNDYNCSCPETHVGKNCENVNQCFSHTCPKNASCLAIKDGFECLTEATFNGSSSTASYLINMDGTSLHSLSWKMRTRMERTALIEIISSSSVLHCDIAVLLEPTGLKLLLNKNSIIEAPLGNVSGKWIDVEIVFSSTGVLINSNGTRNKTNLNEKDASCLRSLNQINVTLASNNKDVPSSFKGCFSDVRLNGWLLPFFNMTFLFNSTTYYYRFLDINLSGVFVGGCHGDQVCQPSRCLYGGACKDEWNSFSCLCAQGYEGRLCEQNTNDCLLNNCTNNSTCLDLLNSYECTCLPGYSGKNCEIKLDACVKNPCMNGGLCFSKFNQSSCACVHGYYGQVCEHADPCYLNPCIHGQCKTNENNNTFTCFCQKEFKGVTCSDVITECDNQGLSCMNGGTCTADNITIKCTCSDGWNGPTCQLSAAFSPSVLSTEQLIGIIVGSIGGALLIVAVIMTSCCIVRLKSRRAKQGVYNPSREEAFGASVQYNEALKIPPEERLI